MSTYLFTQANGVQARSTIKHLLKAGAKIHAVVRDLEKVHTDLKDPRIKIFQGDNHDVDALLKAAEGCKGAYLNTFPDFDVTSEGRQARNILSVCEKAGIESVVAMTTFLTDNKEMWSDPESEPIVGRYYASKAAIEDAVRNSNLKYYTILRPGYIHTDYLTPHVFGNYPALPTKGELAHAYNEGAVMLHIAEDDIGKYAAAAILDPVKFNKQEIDLANEALHPSQVRDIIAKVSGRDIKIRKMSEEEAKELMKTTPGMIFQLWANIHKFESSAKEVEAKWGIPFTSFETYLEGEKERLLTSLPA